MDNSRRGEILAVFLERVRQQSVVAVEMWDGRRAFRNVAIDGGLWLACSAAMRKINTKKLVFVEG